VLTPHRLPTSSADPVPGLVLVDEVFDARVMGPRLASALGRPGRGRRPAAGWHVVDAKYEPGVRCTVLYRAGDLLVRGDLLDGTDTGAAPGPVVDPGVRLSPFPGDPDLPTLAAAADPASLREALRAALPGGAAILRCRVDLLRYRPAKRATFAVEARAHPGRSGRQPQRLVVKCYHDGRKAAAVAEEAVLLDATADAGAPLRFAAVRAHLPELSLVVQDRVAGVPLPEVLRRPGPAPAAALRRAARALAALHRQPVVSRRTRDVDAELARFGSRGRRVAAVAPATGAALVELATRLAATAQDVPEGVVALVHGDCKPSQFLLADGGKVALLDLDSCGRADPAGDVGTFLATLRQSGLRPTAGRPAAASAALAQRAFAELFLREYLQAAAAAPDVDLRRRIAWYEAVALERKALRTFARAPRSPLTRALVAEGHRCLDALGGIR
jgi:aminoglycoside phosphotransferase (APT) family kinase protein